LKGVTRGSVRLEVNQSGPALYRGYIVVDAGPADFMIEYETQYSFPKTAATAKPFFNGLSKDTWQFNSTMKIDELEIQFLFYPDGFAVTPRAYLRGAGYTRTLGSPEWDPEEWRLRLQHLSSGDSVLFEWTFSQ